ncbi:conserved Plasmodium protein, unknown function [Plasmodium yoelii]|uniref:Uncharacterized protein n=2 Tax=Plasmodium yoelii TaxID=5861 RepID=A0AAF0B887_PLAYO|nr:conserved Plasmodium protein, unknown function [Plasmodium yoelii]WBY60225.1 hypothetical protein Py17XNL_001303349 [Plasmodium yoelii yoelii]CDU20119.1 conserved Plasmodium protein, unknown function [Plasmodium yoelii]VTZ80877.1 conserved Plasmodium protein, unknown function [Plasmodium yoelii]|eukprot:XP_724438.2 conserved Plasmodium protein, unknown function [Plasmodium yoelii]
MRYPYIYFFFFFLILFFFERENYVFTLKAYGNNFEKFNKILVEYSKCPDYTNINHKKKNKKNNSNSNSNKISNNLTGVCLKGNEYRKRNIYSTIEIRKLTNLIKKKINNFLKNDQDNNNNNIHPLKNTLWKINTYNCLFQKKKSFYIYIYENGTVKTSDNLTGYWFYDKYYITWCIEYPDRKVYHTSELVWNNEESKMVKGIIYEEMKKTKFFPPYMFRKILCSFDGSIQIN